MEEPVIKYQEIGKKNPSHLLIIVTILLAIIATIILTAYFLLSKTQPTTQPSQPTTQPSQTEITPLQTKIQECATPSPDQNCILLYSTPDIEAKCHQLKELKDQCLYNFAIINERFDTCATIQDTILKNKCQEEFKLSFTSEE